MNAAIVIPARYGSKRFPGKPLALLGGKPVIQHVTDNAAESGLDVYVATDDERISAAVRRVGGRVIMTDPNHENGTSRIAEAVGLMSIRYDAIINVQGDEPFVSKEEISALVKMISEENAEIATLACMVEEPDAASDPGTVKVVVNNSGNAMYFSRSCIPFYRDKGQKTKFLKHIGMYAYRTDVLKAIVKLEPSPLELAENLEQLRWLQNGYNIKVGIVNKNSIGIDTPQDLARAERRIMNFEL